MYYMDAGVYGKRDTINVIEFNNKNVKILNLK